MKTFKQALFYLFTLFSVLLLACEQSPENARRELGKLNIEYSEASFVTCAERGDFLAVKLFLQSGMNPNVKDGNAMTPLMAAAKSGRENVVSLLLQKGADINAKHSERGYNAILFASVSGNLNTVKLILSKGANINDVGKNGDTPLMIAVLMANNIELVKYFIENGAAINAKDNDGNTPLLHSLNMFSRNIDIIKLLLASGADINATDKNNNIALMEVLTGQTTQQSIGIMELLIKSGIKVNAENKKGETALYLCVTGLPFGTQYTLRAMQILLEHGANPNIENLNGDTPIKYIEKLYVRDSKLQYELVNLLKKAATAYPPYILEKKRLNIKYGVIKICTKGRRGPEFIQVNDEHVFTASEWLGFDQYFKEFDDDIVLVWENRGASLVIYRLLTIRKDGSFSITQEFGNGAENKEITIKDNTIFITFPSYERYSHSIKSQKWAYKNSKLEKMN